MRKIEGRRRRGQQRMRWLDGITDSTDICCCCSVAQSCLTLCNLMDCSHLLHHLTECAQTHVHGVSDAIQPPRPLLPPSPPASIFASIRVFSSESALCITWPKYWSNVLLSVFGSVGFQQLLFQKVCVNLKEVLRWFSLPHIWST